MGENTLPSLNVCPFWSLNFHKRNTNRGVHKANFCLCENWLWCFSKRQVNYKHIFICGKNERIVFTVSSVLSWNNGAVVLGKKWISKLTDIWSTQFRPTSFLKFLTTHVNQLFRPISWTHVNQPFGPISWTHQIDQSPFTVFFGKDKNKIEIINWKSPNRWHL